MEIYIEKVVLNKLNIDFLNENLKLGQKKLMHLLENYDELVLCSNISFESSDFELYKFENPLFAKIAEKALIMSFESIDDFLAKSKFEQTIILDEHDDFNKKDLIERKGGLYFTYFNYSKKIEDIIDNCHKKIDLSERFNGWANIINVNYLNTNEVIINDNYLISRLEDINKFVLPLIKAVKSQYELKKVVFITNYLNQQNFRLTEKIEKIRSELNLYNVEVLHNNFRNFTNHDRILYTNFYIIECPIGFNQVNRISNSTITIDTIFDRFTYNKRRRHIKNMELLN